MRMSLRNKIKSHQPTTFKEKSSIIPFHLGYHGGFLIETALGRTQPWAIAIPLIGFKNS